MQLKMQLELLVPFGALFVPFATLLVPFAALFVPLELLMRSVFRR